MTTAPARTAPARAAPLGRPLLVKAADRDYVRALDPAAMTATAVLTYPMRDIEGDLIEPAGGDFGYHRLHPVVGLNHDPLALVGTAEDRAGNYTVRMVESPDGPLPVGTTYFNANDPVAVQTFRLVDDGLIRGVSIESKPLAAGDFEVIGTAGVRKSGLSYRVKRWALTRYDHTPTPMNAGAVTVVLEKGRVGAESLLPVLRKALGPFAAGPRPLVLNVPLPPNLAAKAAPTLRKAGMDELMDDLPAADDAPADDAAPAEDEAGGGGMKPTPKALYNLAQAILDACDRADADGAMGEHEAGLKVLGTLCEQARKIADKAKAKADEIASNGTDDAADADDPEPAETDADGAMVMKSYARHYSPPRFTLTKAGKLERVGTARAADAAAAAARDADADAAEYARLARKVTRLRAELEAAAGS